MDINTIERISNRKRLGEDLSQVQEKVKKENVELIKLQVAQDSAHWELKERLAQLRGEHERLQQNMLQLQMQYEELSARHQDELRHRAETLNKLNATRKIAEVLEGLTQQCKEASSRTEANLAALCETYARSDLVVCGLQREHVAIRESAERNVNELVEKMKLKSERQKQLKQEYAEYQQVANTELGNMKNELKGKETLVEKLKQQLAAAEININKVTIRTRISLEISLQ
ncbi:tropomyosin-like [Bicyclus anynana]|uniref:Tropomyosin-like n=1 Tax=Bicyclus anynana TaxID=110368 RepID=A0ABM3LNH7_BICAN|nr:tropomyosin-like [Bicyclus anynana]